MKTTRKFFKRKVISVGVIAFLLVSLISTGFAMWVVSTNATSETEGNVSVGTVQDGKLVIESYEFTDDLSSFIFEPKESDNTGRVRNDGENYESLKIEITVTVSPAAYLKQATLELQMPTGIITAATEGYINLPSNLSDDYKVVIPKEEMTAGNGESLSFKVAFEFTWGTKFNGQNPGEYYDLDETGKAVTADEVNKTLEDLRATIYGYIDELNEATAPEDRKNVIALHESETLSFKLIITAEAN